jgi:hypothetical protein
LKRRWWQPFPSCGVDLGWFPLTAEPASFDLKGGKADAVLQALILI